jgi:ABC-2 type transport system ATP-binding protein
MEEAEYLCDRIIIMDKGKILAQGTLDELLSTNKSKEIIEFTTTNSFPDQLFCGPDIFKMVRDENTGRTKLIVKSIVDQLPDLLKK